MHTGMPIGNQFYLAGWYDLMMMNMVQATLLLLVLSIVAMGFYTRRFCQRCDYCQQFYWWIGWAAFEWTSLEFDSWAMRCKPCQWLAQNLDSQAHSDLRL
jgi:hypothetical protein